MTAGSIYTDGTYIKHNPTLDSEHSPWKARHIADMLNKCKVSFDSVCEIGCGGGVILSELAGSYFTDKIFHGYDISPDAIDICDKLKRGNLSFSVGSVDDISEKYDLVLCIDVFEHVENDFEFLRNLKEIGKYKIFHIPLEIAVWNVIKYRSFMNVRETVGHIHHYTRETALAVLEDCGYKVKEIKYTRGAIELPYNSFNNKVLNQLRQFTELFGVAVSARVWGGYSLLVLAE